MSPDQRSPGDSPYDDDRSPYQQIMKDVRLFLSNRIVQLLLAITWARLFFPDWVEAVGYETVLKILGGP